MNNFITYEYKFVVPSDLSSKTILMIGRANDINKRFELGIQCMDYIIKEIKEVKMEIISSLDNIIFLQNLIYNLNLERNIKFSGYNSDPEIYFKNASLHIFPSLAEAFPMVLCETKIYGIPNILLGLDYISLSKGGTVIIYDEKMETLAKESLKIIKNEIYRKKLGREARLSMHNFDNKLLLKKWIKLILSVYNGDIYYENLKKKDIKLSNTTAFDILGNQLKLIKKRKPAYENTTMNDFLNLTYFLNFNFNFDKEELN
jgi:glycosyltransferase involved in cell wall biosynthesis